MYCGSCGKELEEDTKFCDSCGAKIEPENLQADAANDETEAVKVEVAAAPEKTAEPMVKEEMKKPAGPSVMVPEPQRVKKIAVSKPLGIFTFLWMFILMVIPPVNIIMILVWALGSNKNVNKKNFGWAAIIFILLAVTGWLLIGVVFAEECKAIYQPIIDWVVKTLNL
jgi:hypothetical protein